MPDMLGDALAEIGRLEAVEDELRTEAAALRRALQEEWERSDAVLRRCLEERKHRLDAEEELADWRAKGRHGWFPIRERKAA